MRLKAKTYLAATANPRRQPGFGPKAYPLEGFLFPATYDFTARETSPQLVAAQLKAFRANWAKLNLAYARSKNLTPYDVLTIASLIEKETPAPEERQLVSAVIYNRLHARMNLGIDATTRYGLHVPPTESLTQSELQQRQPVQHAQPEHHRPDADADRQPGPRLAAGRGAPGEGELHLLRREAGQEAPLLHGQLRRVRAVQGRARLRMSRTRRAARQAGGRVALAADAERRLRRGRARLGVRRGRGRAGRAARRPFGGAGPART